MRPGTRSTQMRYFCWNLVSTPKPKSDGYPILKTVLGSNRVRGKKKRKKAKSQVARKAATAVQTRRRRCWLTSVFSGPVGGTPAAAAALEVPTAGVPTYLTATPSRVDGGEATATAAAAGRAAAGGAGLAVAAAG